MREVLIGQTDYTILVRILTDAGAPATGKVYTDIDLAYTRVETDNDVTTADVAPATLASLTATHSDWGFLLVSDTDHPGLYRLDIADAVFASGAWEGAVTITGTGLQSQTVGFILVPVAPINGVNAYLVAGATPQTVTDLWAQAMSDLAAPPAATASVLAGLNWIFQLARNKVTETATQQKVYKDDASTVAGTATVSDDGTTFTRGEFA